MESWIKMTDEAIWDLDDADVNSFSDVRIKFTKLTFVLLGIVREIDRKQAIIIEKEKTMRMTMLSMSMDGDPEPVAGLPGLYEKNQLFHFFRADTLDFSVGYESAADALRARAIHEHKNIIKEDTDGSIGSNAVPSLLLDHRVLSV
jgi:hypothetical protein